MTSNIQFMSNKKKLLQNNSIKLDHKICTKEKRCIYLIWLERKKKLRCIWYSHSVTLHLHKELYKMLGYTWKPNSRPPHASCLDHKKTRVSLANKRRDTALPSPPLPLAMKPLR